MDNQETPTFHCWTTDHMFNSVIQTLFGETATVLRDLITSPKPAMILE